MPTQKSQHNLSTDLTSPSPPLGFWKRIGFALVNLWLLVHLVAVILAPASVPPSSRLEQSAWRVFAPYVQGLYINHGYHFFAPEPAGSTLLGYDLKLANGEHLTGRLPSKTIQPRLLYHRHFMLTEFLASVNDMQPELKAEVLQAYAGELCREHGAVEAKLTKLTHLLPTMARIRAGGTLDDPESFTEEPLGTFPAKVEK